MEPVDHYNVEMQIKTLPGKWKLKWTYNIIFDEYRNIVDTFD